MAIHAGEGITMGGNQELTVGEGDLYRVLADMAARGEAGVLATVIATRLPSLENP